MLAVVVTYRDSGHVAGLTFYDTLAAAYAACAALQAANTRDLFNVSIHFPNTLANVLAVVASGIDITEDVE